MPWFHVTEIEILFHVTISLLDLADVCVVLPDVPSRVSRAFQLHQPTIVKHFRNNDVLRYIWESDSVSAFPLSGEKIGAAGATDRACNEGLVEEDAFGCQLVNVRRFCDRMPGHAERIKSLVIRFDENNVGFAG